eukprot:symbB.v1.2.036622.t1/scaffold5204.1/size38591/1
MPKPELDLEVSVEDVFTPSSPSQLSKLQVSLQETTGDAGTVELIRCNSLVDAVAYVEPRVLHLLRSKEQLESLPMEECCSGSPIGEDVNDRGDDVGAEGPEALGALSQRGSKTTLAKPEANTVSSQESSKDFDRARRRTRTWVQDVPSSVRTFMVKVTKPTGKEKTSKLGLDIDYAEESTAIPVVDVNGGLVGQWNDENPMKLVRSGDCIVAVNGIQKDVPGMLKNLMDVGQLEMLVVRGTTDEIGTEPVASGLLAAEGYYQQVESQQMAAATKDKEPGLQVAPQAQVPQTVESAEDLARTLAKKRTLNWFVHLTSFQSQQIASHQRNHDARRSITDIPMLVSPDPDAPVEVAVSRNRIAGSLPDGQLVVWRVEGGAIEEVRILFPEPPSMAWCPDGRHLLCFGRHVESFLFLVEGLGGGHCLDYTGAEVKSLNSPFTSAAFAASGNFFATAGSHLSLWRWTAAVPASVVPFVSMANSTELDDEVSKVCFSASAEKMLFALCAAELRIFAFNDADGALTPTRILRWGTGSIGRADVSSAGLLVADGTNLAYVALGDGSNFFASLPQPLSRLALGGAFPNACIMGQGEGVKRCYLLGFDPFLTKDTAIYLRQSYLKLWERSMGQLPRSCGKQLSGAKSQRANGQSTVPLEVLQELLRELQTTQLGDGSPSREVSPKLQVLDSLLPQVVEKLGERLADCQDGQLFHERFLATFPVQGDASLDSELRQELQGVSKWLAHRGSSLSQEWLRECRPMAQCGEILTDALDEAAVQHLHSALDAVPPAEELREVVRDALTEIAREAQRAQAQQAAAPVMADYTKQLLRLRQCAAPLQESLVLLAQEVKETQESLSRLSEPGDTKETHGDCPMPSEIAGIDRWQ